MKQEYSITPSVNKKEDEPTISSRVSPGARFATSKSIGAAGLPVEACSTQERDSQKSHLRRQVPISKYGSFPQVPCLSIICLVTDSYGKGFVSHVLKQHLRSLNCYLAIRSNRVEEPSRRSRKQAQSEHSSEHPTHKARFKPSSHSCLAESCAISSPAPHASASVTRASADRLRGLGARSCSRPSHPGRRPLEPAPAARWEIPPRGADAGAGGDRRHSPGPGEHDCTNCPLLAIGGRLGLGGEGGSGPGCNKCQEHGKPQARARAAAFRAPLPTQPLGTGEGNLRGSEGVWAQWVDCPPVPR